MKFKDMLVEIQSLSDIDIIKEIKENKIKSITLDKMVSDVKSTRIYTSKDGFYGPASCMVKKKVTSKKYEEVEKDITLTKELGKFSDITKILVRSKIEMYINAFKFNPRMILWAYNEVGKGKNINFKLSKMSGINVLVMFDGNKIIGFVGEIAKPSERG